MNKVIIFNFIMLLFITASQDTIKQALDIVTADYEKVAHREVCKEIVERQNLMYADMKEVVLQTCVATSRSDYEYMFKKGGMPDAEIKEKMEPGNEFHEAIKDFCEGGIQNDVLNVKVRRFLVNSYESFECVRFRNEQ